jgi:hypothetical protein
MKNLRKILVVAMLGMFSTSVFASVTFDPATGTGFVGKGDVQSVLGLNNAGLQAIAGNLKFAYEAVDVYEVVAEWYNEVGKDKVLVRKTIEVPRRVNLSYSINYNTRVHKQVDGFFLTGSGSAVNAKVPVVGQPFNDGNDGKIIISVTLVSSTVSGLTVNGVALQL